MNSLLVKLCCRATLLGALLIVLATGCTKEEAAQPCDHSTTTDNTSLKSGRGDGEGGGVRPSGGDTGISDDGDDLGDNEGGRKPRKPRN